MFCVTDPAAFAGRWVRLRSLLLSSSLIELPSIAHKLDEVVIIVDVGRDCRVVVVPFLLGDHTIAVTVAKACEELHEHLLVGHLTADDLRVLAAVVDDTQVGGGNRAAAILIELSEALVNNLHAGLVGCTADSVQEFVVADDAVLVEIQVIEQDLGLALANVSAEVLHAPVELLHVDFTVTVVVEDAERTAHSADSADTACVQAGAHLLENCRNTANQSPVDVKLSS